MEPQSCSAMLDPLGNVIVYASTQALFHTRSQVAHALGLADHQVTLNAQAVGGGFGGKFGFLEATVAALAKAVGRPVRMAYTRMEEFTSADPAPQSVVRVKIGATKDGTLTTLDVVVGDDVEGRGHGAYSKHLFYALSRHGTNGR
jgi:CO/xanthine dehydrogenase Mo-binding subunit